MTLYCKMTFACVVLVAVFASINAAPGHAGETTLTRASNTITVDEKYDGQKTGTLPSINDNHFSTMVKKTEMPIGKKLRLTIGILNKLVEKKKNVTESFINLFHKLRDSGEILSKNDNTDIKGTTELSSAADVTSVNNSAKSGSRLMSDINKSLPSVLPDNGFNATSEQFIKDLLSNNHANDTTLHHSNKGLPHTARPFLFEFDDEDVKREKIIRNGDDEEEDEEEDDEERDEEEEEEDKPNLTSNFPMKQSSLETPFKDDGPLNLNWNSDFPQTHMPSNILFEDEEPINLIPVRQIHPVQQIQTSNVRRNRQELIPQGTSRINTPRSFLASSLQRNQNPEEEIAVLQKYLKFAEDFPNYDDKVLSSIQNEDELFDAFNGGDSFLNIIVGDTKKPGSGQEKESEEEVDVSRGIENESVVRSDTQTLEGSTGPKVSKPNSENLIAALFADDPPEVNVVNFNHNREVQDKDSDEETGNEAQKLSAQSLSREDDAVENIWKVNQEDDNSNEDHKRIRITAARNSQEDSTSNEDYSSGARVNPDSGAGHASDKDDSDEQRPLPDSKERSRESTSGEDLTDSHSAPSDGDSGSTEQTSSKENSFENSKDSSKETGNSDSEIKDESKSGSNDKDSSEESKSSKSSSKSSEGSNNKDSSEESKSSKSSSESSESSNDKDSSEESKSSKSSSESSESSNDKDSSEESKSSKSSSESSESSNDKDSSEESKSSKSSSESSESSNDKDSSEESKSSKSSSESSEEDVKTIQDRKPVRPPTKPLLQHNPPRNYPLFDKPRVSAPIPPGNRHIRGREPEADEPRDSYENKDLLKEVLIRLRKPKVNTPIRPEPEVEPPREIYNNGDFPSSEDDRFDDLNLQQPIRNDDDLILAISQIEKTLPMELEQIKLRNSLTKYRKNPIYGRSYDARHTQYSGGTDYGTNQGYTWYSTLDDDDDYGTRRVHTEYFTDTDDVTPIHVLSAYDNNQFLKLTEKELRELNKIYWASRNRRPATEKKLRELNKIYLASRNRRPATEKKLRELNKIYWVSRSRRPDTEKELRELNKIYWASRNRRPARYYTGRNTHRSPGVRNGHEKWNSKVRSRLLRGRVGRRRRTYGKRHYGGGTPRRLLIRGRFGTKRRRLFRSRQPYRKGGVSGRSRLLRYLTRIET